MKKIWFHTLVLALAVSCSAEGGIGQPCREGSEYPCGGVGSSGIMCSPEKICVACGVEDAICCENGCRTGLTCSPDDRCLVCGSENNPCCEGGWCTRNFFCNEKNLCLACGTDEGEPCCQNTFCYGGRSCVEGICTNQICGADGGCQHCGTIGEPCCPGSTCAADSTCNTEMVCAACGGLNEPACVNQMCGYWQRDLETDAYSPCECDAWFVNVDSVCSIPFKTDPQAPAESCMGLFLAEDGNRLAFEEPSTTEIENIEWCYWYAAYYKGDLQICENIMWGEMREKCSLGENPEEYYATIKIERD